MTSELSKCLNEQLGAFLNVKQQNEVTQNIKKGFLNKNVFT